MQQPFFIGVINVVQLDVSINVGVVMSKTAIKKRLHTCYKNTAKGLHCRCLRIASFKIQKNTNEDLKKTDTTINQTF